MREQVCVYEGTGQHSHPLSFQDYDSMISLVEKISGHQEAAKPPVQVQCAFALNRRNKEGDRSRALAILEKVFNVYSVEEFVREKYSWCDQTSQ